MSYFKIYLPNYYGPLCVDCDVDGLTLSQPSLHFNDEEDVIDLSWDEVDIIIEYIKDLVPKGWYNLERHFSGNTETAKDRTQVFVRTPMDII